MSDRGFRIHKPYSTAECCAKIKPLLTSKDDKVVRSAIVRELERIVASRGADAVFGGR